MIKWIDDSDTESEASDEAEDISYRLLRASFYSHPPTKSKSSKEGSTTLFLIEDKVEHIISALSSKEEVIDGEEEEDCVSLKTKAKAEIKGKKKLLLLMMKDKKDIKTLRPSMNQLLAETSSASAIFSSDGCSPAASLSLSLSLSQQQHKLHQPSQKQKGQSSETLKDFLKMHYEQTLTCTRRSRELSSEGFGSGSEGITPTAIPVPTGRDSNSFLLSAGSFSTIPLMMAHSTTGTGGSLTGGGSALRGEGGGGGGEAGEVSSSITGLMMPLPIAFEDTEALEAVTTTSTTTTSVKELKMHSFMDEMRKLANIQLQVLYFIIV